jgi:SSS family solute:Na+ symporter
MEGKKMTAIYIALVVYMVVLFGIGMFYSKKNATINDFLLAGRNLGLVAATLTITASLFGGGLLTGTAQSAYNSGPMMYVYGVLGSGGGLFFAALLTQKMKDFSNYGTITEYLEVRFGSRFLRVGSGILSMIALIAIVGGQVAAVTGIMNALGIANTPLVAGLAMVVIIALTTMGGLMAVTVTDGFQIILVIFGVFWVTGAALGDVGGFAGLNASLAAMESSLPENYNVFMNAEHFKTLLWMLLPGFMYIMIGQDVYQRLFACKNHKTAVRSAICSAFLIMIIAVMPVIIGLIARVQHPELAANGTSAAAFAVLAVSTLPGWAVGIIIAAALSAILSTADSCLSAAGSHFMTDFYMLYMGKDVDPNDKKLVTVSRIFTVVAGVAAVVVSMLVPSILDACFYAYYIFTGGVFCPIVFGVFWKKTTRQGAVAGLISGGVFVMISLLTGFNIGGMGGELLSGVLSAIVLVAVSLATQPKSAEA